MSAPLRISKQLALSDDFVTKTCGILAQRRKGKTYTASVLAEEFVAAKMPFAVLDPTGAWWGLRAAADGVKPGLPVVIVGGEHGDVPIERTGGKVIADLVVEHPGYYVIDLSPFDSHEAERQFATDFAERLYRRKRQPRMDFAMHLFVDEADLFAPQQSPSGDKRMLGAFENIVRRGGLHGLGTTLISQRSAVVNKNVLEQLDVLIVLRTVGTNDRDAIFGYVKKKSDTKDPEILAMMDSLPSLPIGEAWVWEPGGEPPLFERVRIRERRTFNSSATPKPGERRVEPKRLADVDLKAVTQAMAATIERAEAEDPRKLRRQVADLQRQVRALEGRKQSATPEPVIEHVDVPVFRDGEIDRLEKAIGGLVEVGAQLVAVAKDVGEGGVLVSEAAQTVAHSLSREAPAREPRPRDITRPTIAKPQPRPLARGPRSGRSEVRSEHAIVRDPDVSDDELTEYARSLLETLAERHPMKLTRVQLSLFSGRSKRSSMFSPAVRELTEGGYATYQGRHFELTDRGLAEAGVVPHAPSSPAEVQAMWLSKLPAYEASLLRVLLDEGGNTLSREELSERSGRSLSSSMFSPAIRTLLDMGLVQVSDQDLGASEDLFG
jgi:hypothetical protein